MTDQDAEESQDGGAVEGDIGAAPDADAPEADSEVTDAFADSQIETDGGAMTQAPTEVESGCDGCATGGRRFDPFLALFVFLTEVE